MKSIIKLLKNEAMKYAIFMNILYLIFFLMTINPPGGGWGYIDAFLTSVWVFPIIVFMMSFIFKPFKQRLLFNSLSVIVILIVMLQTFIIPSFDREDIFVLLAYIFFPIISALVMGIVQKGIKRYGD